MDQETLEDNTPTPNPAPEADTTNDTRLAAKDEYIAQLELERNELKTQLAATKNMEAITEDLMDRLNNTERTPQNTVEARATSPQDPGTPPTEATPADLAEAVRKILAEENTKATRDTNIKTAKNELKSVYGDQYMSNLESVAETMGVGVNFLTEMAARSPKGLVDLVKLHKPVQEKVPPRTVAPPPSSVSSPSPANTVRKNSAYYAELRKTDLSRYMSRQVQAEMHREAMEQGTAFYE